MTHVDAAAVMGAAHKIHDSGLGVSEKMRALGQALSDTLGMAGTDTAAQSFGGAYDPAARSVYDAIGKIGDGTTKIGMVLAASAHNHNDANAAAAHQPAPNLGPMPQGPTACYQSFSVPNSAGDPSPGPWWWKVIASYVQGKVWPNGHQDKLRASATAWEQFADGITSQSQGFYDGLQVLQTQDADDIGAGQILTSDAYDNLFTIAQNARTIAQACRDHAQNIDDAHSQIESAAAEIIIETGVIWAAGALLTVVTAGGSDAAAGALSAANLSRIGANIARIITGFEGTVAATTAGAVRVGPAAAGIANAMSRVAGLPVTRIAATAAGANAIRLGADEQAQLRRIANETDYEKYVRGKQNKELTPRSYDDYITARDKWAATNGQSEAREQLIAETKGLTEENGWKPQQLAPNGLKRGEEGSRIWDFANFDKKEAVEVKSGQVPEKDFSRQLEIDENMVRTRGWSMTYSLQQSLNPSQMTRLAELQSKYPGKFTVEIGMP